MADEPAPSKKEGRPIPRPPMLPLNCRRNNFSATFSSFDPSPVEPSPAETWADGSCHTALHDARRPRGAPSTPYESPDDPRENPSVADAAPPIPCCQSGGGFSGAPRRLPDGCRGTDQRWQPGGGLYRGHCFSRTVPHAAQRPRDAASSPCGCLDGC